MAVSASVMASYFVRHAGAGDALELVVLWRGTPGWFATGGPSGSSGGGGGTIWRHRFRDGGHEFEIVHDVATRTAIVAGITVKLGEANVVFVDEVDSPGGPRVGGTLTVNAQLGEERGPGRVLPVLGQSQEIREYLRCGTPLPDPKWQPFLAPVCARILGAQ
jgi:hypothetical protein